MSNPSEDPPGSTNPDDTPSGEVRLSGHAVAPGTVLGPAWRLDIPSSNVNTTPLPADAVADEVARFNRAAERAAYDLQTVIDLAHTRLGTESASIFEAQAMILRDEALLEAVRTRIRENQRRASAAVHTVLRDYRERLESSDTPYLQERAADLHDTEQRLLRALHHRRPPSTDGQRGVVVAHTLSAADVIRFSQSNVLGCVCSTGGPTSHAALIARALQLPTVMGVQDLMAHVNGCDWLLLDGEEGAVVVRPEAETREAFHDEEATQAVPRESQPEGPLHTTDGTRVQVLANIEFADQYRTLATQGAEGVGLLRTEMLFLMQSRMQVSEEVQYEQYTGAADALNEGQPLTIRLLDIGGDKMQPMRTPDSNAFLGWRGIRVLLDRTDLVCPQLRALLRLARQRPVRVLLPMVTNCAEIEAMHTLIDEAADDLGYAAWPEGLHVGIMVEVPAVALQADLFAQKVDFFALGTNDLTQYTLAAERNNAKVAHLTDALHPAVLMLIRRTVQAAETADIPVSVCGEVASDPVAVPVLLGLGLRTLSMAPPFIDTVRAVVAQVDRAAAETLAEAACTAQDAAAVRALCTDWQQRHNLVL